MPPVTDPGLLARPPHAATASRLTWEHLPPGVRAVVEELLGSPVVAADSQDSGFTPGFASRLTTAQGARVFLKAAHLTAQRPFARAYAREAEVTRLLPLDLPAPRVRWTRPDVEGWLLVAYDDVEGRPPRRPWEGTDLRACLDALTDVDRALSAGTLDGADLAPLVEDLPTFVDGWDLAGASGLIWPRHDELTELAHACVDLPTDHVAHLDVRDDNFILRPDGSALLCDWTWPGLAPRWADVVQLLVSAHGDGVDVAPLLAPHPLTAGVADDDLDVFVAGLGAYLAESELRPVPSTSPHLGTHRRWWAAACWSWLASRRGWA